MRRRVLQAEVEGLWQEAGSRMQDASSKMQEAIKIYGRHRLLTFDRDPLTRGPTIEVAHEALLREWGRLRGWLEESRGDVRLQRLLAAAAGEWEAVGREPSYLLQGARLAQFEGWAAGSQVALTGGEIGRSRSIVPFPRSRPSRSWRDHIPIASLPSFRLFSPRELRAFHGSLCPRIGSRWSLFRP